MPEPLVTPEFTITPDDAIAILFNAREYREYDVEAPQTTRKPSPRRQMI